MKREPETTCLKQLGKENGHKQSIPNSVQLSCKQAGKDGSSPALSPVLQIEQAGKDMDENRDEKISIPTALALALPSIGAGVELQEKAHSRPVGESCSAKSPVLLDLSGGREQWPDVSGNELFSELAQEMDRWERELESNKNGSEVVLPSDNIMVVQQSCGPGASAWSSTTPLRSQFVTHVAPVTLLASAKQGLLPSRGFYGTDKEPSRTECSKTPRLPSASPISVVRGYPAEKGAVGCVSDGPPVVVQDVRQQKGSHVRHEQGCTPKSGSGFMVRGCPAEKGAVGDGPPVVVPDVQQQKASHISTPKPGNSSITSRSPLTIEETPPLEQGINPVVMPSDSGTKDGSLNPPRNSMCSKVSSEGSSFKTPNISRWLNSKCCTNSFSPSPVSPKDSSSIFSLAGGGGKITPPLCGCGRRAKRKFVCSPGPNEGLPFYVCPNSRGSDRKRGCNYFKWEKRGGSDCSNSEPLLSDYGESRY